MTQQDTPERLTREEKKARTRAQLIDAAAAVFARHGYVAASLDEVAEEAGLTKGAVYSNFDSKEDLFQAVIDDRLNEPMFQVADIVDPVRVLEKPAHDCRRVHADVEAGVFAAL